jgi:DNA-binding NarL/FixJ family response regulator
MDPILALIVGDYAYFCRTLKAHLEENCRVRVVATASSGPGAVALAEELVPSVAIMKIHLPDVNGLGVCQRMKARNPALRVIRYTGYAPEIYAGRPGFCADACIRQDALFEQLSGIIGTLFPTTGPQIHPP